MTGDLLSNRLVNLANRTNTFIATSRNGWFYLHK